MFSRHVRSEDKPDISKVESDAGQVDEKFQTGGFHIMSGGNSPKIFMPWFLQKSKINILLGRL